MASYHTGRNFLPIPNTKIYKIKDDSPRLHIRATKVSNGGTLSSNDFVNSMNSHYHEGTTNWDAPSHQTYRLYHDVFVPDDDNTTYVTSSIVQKDLKADIGDRPPGAGGIVYYIRDDGRVEIFRNLTLDDYITCTWNDYYDTTHDYSLTETAYHEDGTPYQKTISNWERVNMTEMTRIADNVLAPYAFEPWLQWDPTDPPYYWTTEKRGCGRGCTAYGVYNVGQMYYPYTDKYSWLEGGGASNRGVIAMRRADNYFPGPHNNFHYTFNRELDEVDNYPVTFVVPNIHSIQKVRWADSTVDRAKDSGNAYGSQPTWLYIIPVKEIDVPSNVQITDLESDSLALNWEYSTAEESEDNQSYGYLWKSYVDIGGVIKPTTTPTSIDLIPDYSGDDSITIKPEPIGEEDDEPVFSWSFVSTGPIPPGNITKVTYSDDLGNTGEYRLGVDYDTHDVHVLDAYYMDGDENTGTLVDPADEYFNPTYDTPVWGEFLYTTIHTDYIFGLPAQYGSMIIAKNSEGQAYFPEYNFNGMGYAVPSQGFHMKASAAFELKFEGLPNLVNLNPNSTITTLTAQETIKLQSGWQIMRYPGMTEINMVSAFSPIIDNVIIVKDAKGKAYLPEWNFNGIGNMIPGSAYLIKMTGDTSSPDTFELTF